MKRYPPPCSAISILQLVSKSGELLIRLTTKRSNKARGLNFKFCYFSFLSFSYKKTTKWTLKKKCHNFYNLSPFEMEEFTYWRPAMRNLSWWATLKVGLPSRKSSRSQKTKMTKFSKKIMDRGPDKNQRQTPR